ncbi:hypothetical protein LTR36_004840 [Oleoguttula mirabilis]|uniref:Uncharacterized protein n=1 Tax=Oleoguttula mirabilis TaxID=1507867 RepID=A0AAV9JF96_9PEZI|nr:hypothetical protein LTR36_004840 [Oleoguttula mirabilis]
MMVMHHVLFACAERSLGLFRQTPCGGGLENESLKPSQQKMRLACGGGWKRRMGAAVVEEWRHQNGGAERREDDELDFNDYASGV